MTPERWERVKALFADATAVAPEARLEFVKGAAQGDDELRDEVLSLLRASEGADSLPAARAAIAAAIGGEQRCLASRAHRSVPTCARRSSRRWASSMRL